MVLGLSSACMRQVPVNDPLMDTRTSTATPSRTPTPNPTERYQTTLQANQTQNAVHEATRAAYAAGSAATATALALTPTATPTATPLPEWALNGPENYALAEVDAEVLVDSLIAVYRLQQTWSECNDLLEDCSAHSFGLKDSWNLVRLIEKQSEAITAGEMAEALIAYQEVFNEDGLYIDWSRHSYVFDQGFLELVVSHFNEESVRFNDGQGIDTSLFTASVKQTNIDRDPEPEWLLKVYFEDYGFLSWMLLNESPEGQYSQIDFPITRWRSRFTDEIEIRVEDLTGDSRDELAVISDFYLGGGGYYLNFTVYTFSDSRLVELSNISNSYHGFEEEDTYYDWVLNPTTGPF